MLTSANTCRTGRSVLEAAVGQPIVHFQDLRLAGRVLASQGAEADFILLQIDFTTNQAVVPDSTQRPGLPQQGDLALGVAPPQVAPGPAGRFLQVGLPPGGEGAGVRGGLDARPALLEKGSKEPLGIP